MKRSLAVALVLAVAGGGVALAAQVNVDYDRKIDFSKYKSFILEVGTPARTPFGQERLDTALAAQIKEKGLTQVTDGTADLTVVTHVQHDTKKVADVSTFGYGGYPGWYGWGGAYGSSTVSVREIPTGMLVVDIVDGSTGTLVWRGTASDTIPNSEEKLQKNVEKALRKMFFDFPPGAEPKKKKS